jgi:BirA family biotin operon repressor/biotin-[acetyl-CoA-carboxylase] ligase
MLIGSNIIYREKVSSTNKLAAEMLAAESVAEGTLIYAVDQYNGKGQRGNKWVSEAGKNLTVSIILYPGFLEADKQFMISKVISLSIAGFLDAYSDSISIKWPNDIYHKDDKIAGILIENSLEGSKILNSIVGAGININQVTFPPEISNPVSLSMINKREYDIGTAMVEFCRTCDIWYNRLRKGHLSYIDKQYTDRLYRLNIPSRFITARGTVSGKITGVDRFGRIKIEMDNGNNEVYGFREIEFTD